MKLKYILKGLDCANCAQKIEDQISKLSSVKECRVVFATTTLFVETIDTSDEVIKQIKNCIINVEPDIEIQEVEHAQKHHPKCDHDHDTHEHHESCSCEEHGDHQHQENVALKNAINLSIRGLDCASCATKIENRINALDSIEKAVVNFSTETLLVKVKTNMQQEDLLKLLQKTINEVESGVSVTIKEAITVIEKPKLFSIKENFVLVIGVVAFIIGMFMETNMYDYVLLLLSYLLIGYKVLYKAFKNILRMSLFDENFLMCVATIGAICIGEYEEAVAVMLFYSIGEIFQSYAVNKTRSSISSLMDIKSEYANVSIDGKLTKVNPEVVNVGETLVVKVGEKIPLDGIVIKGQSTLDTSSLTGESMPRDVKENQEVLAGVVNLTEILHIQVTKPYEDSTVSKILELMENAASKKAPIEQFITRFAKVYTPTVVALAFLLAVVPMFIFKDAVFSDWLYRALTFLVVSCPCALVVSIPLGLYAGLGKASKMGVLIKGGNYLELLKDINTVVFDKTGTLTQGTFEVIEINGSQDLLMYGAYGEFLSNHPIGKSMVAKYSKIIDQTRIKDFKEIAGKGIAVYIDNKLVHLGNTSYLRSLNIDVQEPTTVGTVVHIAIDNEYQGNIVVADKIKPSTLSGINKLKQVGIKNTVMLSGDRKSVAEDIANKLGIDTVYSELLPQDKVQQVESLMAIDTCKLAFVGDGINDAPVLARANIGIAMGGVGSDAAIEAADIVLMKDNIEAIGDAIDISHKTNSILKQNVIFTLVIKMGVLLLTMFGFANMWMGVFADVGVTLLAIINSMRILK